LIDLETAIARADKSAYYRRRTALKRRVKIKQGLCIDCNAVAKAGVRCSACAWKHRLAQRLRKKRKFEHLERDEE
jgi:hypothetical protein